MRKMETACTWATTGAVIASITASMLGDTDKAIGLMAFAIFFGTIETHFRIMSLRRDLGLTGV